MWGQRRDDASTYLPTLLHPRNPLLLEFSTLDLLLHASSTSASCLPSFFLFPSSLDFPSNSFVSPPSPFFSYVHGVFFFPSFLRFYGGGFILLALRVDDSWWRFRAVCCYCCSAAVKYARGSMMSGRQRDTRCYIIDNDCLGMTWVDDVLRCK